MSKGYSSKLTVRDQLYCLHSSILIHQNVCLRHGSSKLIEEVGLFLQFQKAYFSTQTEPV